MSRGFGARESRAIGSFGGTGEESIRLFGRPKMNEVQKKEFREDIKRFREANEKANKMLEAFKESKKKGFGAKEGGLITTPTDEDRTRAYEAQGMTRSDAQSAVEAENQSWKDGKPPLGAPGYTPNPREMYAPSYGSRAFLAVGKDLKEIKSMIATDLKSKEAKELGILKVTKATSRASGWSSKGSLQFGVQLDIETPESLRGDAGQDRQYQIKMGRVSFTKEEKDYIDKKAKMIDLVNRIVKAYDTDKSDIMTDYFDKTYYANVQYTNKDGDPI